MSSSVEKLALMAFIHDGARGTCVSVSCRAVSPLSSPFGFELELTRASAPAAAAAAATFLKGFCLSLSLFLSLSLSVAMIPR